VVCSLEQGGCRIKIPGSLSNITQPKKGKLSENGVEIEESDANGLSLQMAPTGIGNKKGGPKAAFLKTYAAPD
jgi:hypothetical protein